MKNRVAGLIVSALLILASLGPADAFFIPFLFFRHHHHHHYRHYSRQGVPGVPVNPRTLDPSVCREIREAVRTLEVPTIPGMPPPLDGALSRLSQEQRDYINRCRALWPS